MIQRGTEGRDIVDISPSADRYAADPPGGLKGDTVRICDRIRAHRLPIICSFRGVGSPVGGMAKRSAAMRDALRVQRSVRQRLTARGYSPSIGLLAMWLVLVTPGPNRDRQGAVTAPRGNNRRVNNLIESND